MRKAARLPFMLGRKALFFAGLLLMYVAGTQAEREAWGQRMSAQKGKEESSPKSTN